MQVQLTGLDQYRQLIGDLSGRRTQAAIATAVTRTAIQVRSDALAGLRSSLDRPTPYTQRQLRYAMATADNPVAAVGFNVTAVQDMAGNVVRFDAVPNGETPAGKYLSPNIRGGTRGLKGFELALRSMNALPSGWFVVPGKTLKLDNYGNVSRRVVSDVLAQMRLQVPGGFSRSKTGGMRAIKAEQKAGGRFFAVPPGGKMQPGIYQREYFHRNIAPIFIFVRSVRYRPLYRFDIIVEGVGKRILPGQVERALKEQIARAAQAAGAKGLA